VPRTASILHADVDAFFASVAQRDAPELRGKPVIVGAGVVMAASYEARAFGVRSGMGGRRARLLCPDAIVVGSDFDAYSRASSELFELFRDTAPVVEGLSMEEAFLDVTGLEHVSGEPSWIAAVLRRRAREQLGLPLSVGVARTKSLAKMASRAAKPDGMLAVPPERELDFLHPLAVEQLWGVGPATAAKLHALGARTVGEMAALGLPRLLEVFGEASGRHLHALAHSADVRRVDGRRGRRSFGSQSAFRPGPRTEEELERILSTTVDRVTRRMRAAGRAGRTVTLRLRFGDYARASRSRSLQQPTNSSAAIGAVALALLREHEDAVRSRGLTLIGVGVTNLAPPGSGVQLALEPAAEALESAVDEIRNRYGSAAVRPAAMLANGSTEPESG